MLLDPQTNDATLEVDTTDLDWYRIMKTLNSHGISIDDKVYQEAYKNLRITNCISSRLNKAARNLTVNGGRGIFETSNNTSKIDLVENFVKYNKIKKFVVIVPFTEIKTWLGQMKLRFPDKQRGLIIRTQSRKEFSGITKPSFTDDKFEEDILIIDINSIISVAKRYNFAKKFADFEFVAIDKFEPATTNLRTFLINFYSVLFFTGQDSLVTRHGFSRNAAEIAKIVCWQEEQFKSLTFNLSNTNEEKLKEVLRRTRLTI